MDECHMERVNTMIEIIFKVPELKKDKVLEVACEDGRLSRDLFVSWFLEIHLFDQCPEGLKKVRDWSRDIKSVKSIVESSMENYPFLQYYDLITLNWCIGYLSDSELVVFLKKCKDWLRPSEKRSTR